LVVLLSRCIGRAFGRLPGGVLYRSRICWRTRRFGLRCPVEYVVGCYCARCYRRLNESW
jgi:hypothetical protein